MDTATRPSDALRPLSLNIRGSIIEFSRPYVMGILNITPDSFYGPSRVSDPRAAVMKARTMIADGADIIDIGACSTRPGSTAPDEEEELGRLMPALKAIREALPEAIISVDTFRSGVAEACLSNGLADIINDVSGGEDPEMFAAVARHKAAYILMHSRGDAESMDALCRYGDVVADVVSELAFRLSRARSAGICDIIVDPGFGFAKTTEQNFRLLASLDRLQVLGCPILAGISRKRMTRQQPQDSPADSLPATLALNTAALLKGASIIRVHDVPEAVQTAKAIEKLWKA